MIPKLKTHLSNDTNFPLSAERVTPYLISKLAKLKKQQILLFGWIVFFLMFLFQISQCSLYFVLFFIGEKHIFVPIFSHDSHFGPYILFLPFLVPIFYFISVLVLSVNAVRALTYVANEIIKIIIKIFILSLKNVKSAFKFKKIIY